MRKLTQEEFIKRAREVHGDKYDYSLVRYVNSRTDVDIICPIHGVFPQSPSGHIHQKQGCPKCSPYAQRKLICGFGINDLAPNECRKIVYVVWRSMICRCYDKKYQESKPTYIGCKVCDEWRYLSAFKKWFDENYVEGYQLDKDILAPGNKIYSPDTCCFVPPEINILLIAPQKRKDGLPRGVYLYGRNRKFSAIISDITEKNRHRIIGKYDTVEDASRAFNEARVQKIHSIAQEYFDKHLIAERVYGALMRYETEITD